MNGSLESKVQLLVDRLEIRDVVEAYVHSRDHADPEATIDLYHPDSTENHGPIKESGWRFAALAAEAFRANWKGCGHLLGQSRIKVTGDSAGAETYFYATLTRDADGMPMLDEMMGRYVDRLERRDGQWRILVRQCVSNWSRTGPITEDFLQGHTFMQSQLSAEDPSYEVLGLKRGCSRIQR